MALQSPRFRSSRKLVQAEAGLTIRTGASGRHVHLVQMALIDLGYPMPRSTTDPRYSPDGVFGNETRDKLIAFQNANRIPPTGAIDRATIQALDRLCRNYSHRVRLHFRSLSENNVPFERGLSDAEIVYGQYGIKIEFASGMSLMLTAQEEADFAVVDDACTWTITDGEYARLHQMGPAIPQVDIGVFYVRALSDAGGCGGHMVGRPACTVAANVTRWATAHEVGHVLLTSNFNPTHVASNRNLMMADVLHFSTTPVLTDRQVAQIKASPCCTRV
ncbi:MAG: peptidoglycan-binding protein [Acidobacteria bacterium]|nr:peptidoglycan-binding protein [Acidobacteriota bacterium]